MTGTPDEADALHHHAFVKMRWTKSSRFANERIAALEGAAARQLASARHARLFVAGRNDDQRLMELDRAQSGDCRQSEGEEPFMSLAPSP